jgi:chemotaxis protein MotB
VTFADLMALLMSFFVMIAAYSTQDQRKLQLVAGSMRDAFGVTRESRWRASSSRTGFP